MLNGWRLFRARFEARNFRYWAIAVVDEVACRVSGGGRWWTLAVPGRQMTDPKLTPAPTFLNGPSRLVRFTMRPASIIALRVAAVR